MYDDTAATQKPKPNVLGIVGFVLSILCITAPIGLILSLVALRRPPRGLAIAGVIVGLIASIILAFAVYTFSLAGPYAIGGTMMITDMQAIQQSAGGATPADLSAAPADAQVDYWNNTYRYLPSPDGASFELTSAGPDGQFDTDDDFTLRSDMTNDQMGQEMQHWINGIMERKFDK